MEIKEKLIMNPARLSLIPCGGRSEQVAVCSWQIAGALTKFLVHKIWSTSFLVYLRLNS
jgi:hypothetical protein